MGAFVGLWIAQIIFGAVVATTNPKRNDVSDRAQNARTLAIFGGLLPCVGFMLFLQVVWLIGYRIMIARAAHVQQRLQPQLQTSFDTPSPLSSATPSAGQDNPFL